MRTPIIAIVASLATQTLGCGGGVNCAEGTFRSGENCIGFDPNDTTPPTVTLDPPPRRSRDPLPATIAVTTSELAQIYITTDGSDPDPTGPGEPSPITIVDLTNGMTVKYFAIDLAGNQSALEMATYSSDTQAPGKPTNLAVTPGATDATLTWTNPPDGDLAGVLITRVVEVIDGAPETGVIYNLPQPLTPNLDIVQVGSASQFVDSGRSPGRVRYVLWAYDDLGNYSSPASVRGEVALGDLEFEFSIDTSNNALTVVTPSVALDLTGTTASGSGTVTLNLHLKNNSTSFFHNPKAEVVSTTGANFATTDPTADGRSFVDLGPATLAPGATVIKPVVFTAVTNGATFRLKLGHHPSLIGSRNNRSRQLAFVDSGAVFQNNSVRETSPFTMLAKGPQNHTSARPSLFVGEHFVDVPTVHGTIERWDMVTQTRVAGIDVSSNGDFSSVQGVFSDGANVYALVKAGKKRASAALTLVRYDENLRETGRLELPLVDSQGFTHPAVSPDGSTLAVPLGTQIVLVNLDTLTLKDADPTTLGIDTIATGVPDRIRAVTFFDGSAGLFVIPRFGDRTEAIRLTATGNTTTSFQDTFDRHTAVALVNGNVYVAAEQSLRIFDPVADTLSPTPHTGGAHAILFSNGQMRVLKGNRSQVDLTNPATGAILSTSNLSFTAIGHWLQLTTP